MGQNGDPPARREDIPRWLRQPENLSNVEITQLRARQAVIYGGVRKRWDLVWAEEIAELYASAHNMSLGAAFKCIERSILHGEFGFYPRRRVFWLPNPPRIDERPHPLKVTDGNITEMRIRGCPIIGQLWFTRAEATVWMRSNNVAHIPSWLTSAAVIEGELAGAPPLELPPQPSKSAMGAQKPRKDPKGPSLATQAGIRAIAHFNHRHGLSTKDEPSLLAKKITDHAVKNALLDANHLTSRSMTVLVIAAQDGVRRADLPETD
jgi:hypothetical protein